MNGFCALLPLASAFVSLSYGGATTPFVLLQILVLLPLIKFVGRQAALALTPLFFLSVIMRLASLVTVSMGALTLFGAVVFAVICLAISCVAAVRSDTAFRLATPLFFVAALFAVLVTVISFSSALREPFADPSAAETIASFVCPVSSCVAFACFAKTGRFNRFCASVVGVTLCAVFIIFDSAGAEFAFLSVPLAVLVSSVEIKAMIKGIKG